MNEEKLKELQCALDVEDKIDNELRIRQNKFNLENVYLFERKKNIQQTIIDCKDILRENAEEGYKKDGEKKRLGGIGIRILKTLHYNSEEALLWAKNKDLFLQLDKTAFEKVARTGQINFVELGEKITVTFPKNIIME